MAAARPICEHWSTFAHEADVGVRGEGATPAEAFAGAATALTAVVADPHAVAPREALPISCAAPTLDLLLLDWLNALVYEMATRRMLFSRYDVRIDAGRLEATAWGEAVAAARHQPAAEVKGASLCELRVGQDPRGRWFAQCVVDV